MILGWETHGERLAINRATKNHHSFRIQKVMFTLHKIWVNYNDLTATSLEIMVSKGNHPQMALIQVSEIL